MMPEVGISIKTPAGTLSVEKYTDSDYPGFTLYLDGEQVGVFEYDSFKEAVRIHVWNKPGADTDPVAQITIAPAV